MRNNPAAVVHHLTDNLVGIVRFLIVSAFAHYPVLVPATQPGLVLAESLVASNRRRTGLARLEAPYDTRSLWIHW